MQDNNDVQKKLQKKRNLELVAYFKELVGKEGLFATIRRTAMYIKRRYGNKKGRFLPKAQTLQKQKNANTAGWPCISVCVPAYNPDKEFFVQLLDSLQEQSYANWQLCISDASDDKSIVQELVAQQKDSRIVVVGVSNQGIGLNTNKAAELAVGEYISLLDHDDLLGPSALFELAKAAFETKAEFIYTDEALFSGDMQNAHTGHFKPDYSPQYLLSVNYITHAVAIKRDLFWEVGAFREGFDGSQDHDLFLRVLEKNGGAHHIPKVLYFWRQHAASTSMGVEAKPYVEEAAKKAIADHLMRKNIRGDVVAGRFPSTYKVNYEIVGSPLVSVIIPSFEHPEDLKRCVDSIYAKISYENFEIIIIENNSKEAATFELYDKLIKEHRNCRVEVFKQQGGFNFPALCNFGRSFAKGEYLLFLNNDTELISADWLEEMLGLCQQPEIAVVGAMLYYPDDTVQHAGVIVGLGGQAGHSHKYARRGRSGYMFRLACAQELSAVTAACLMCKTKVFDEVDGFDTEFAVAFNDVDFCLRVQKAGHSIVFTPYAELYHHESKSRGLDEAGEAKQRFLKEKKLLVDRWGKALLKDPFYSPNLTLDREDFSENDVLPEV